MARKIKLERLQSKNSGVLVTDPADYDKLLSVFYRDRERFILKELRRVTNLKRNPQQPILTQGMVTVGLFNSTASAVRRLNFTLQIFNMPYRLSPLKPKTGEMKRKEFALFHVTSKLVTVN